MATLQEMGNISEVIEKSRKDKNFTPSSRKCPKRLSVPAVNETLVAFKIVRIEFSETDAK